MAHEARPRLVAGDPWRVFLGTRAMVAAAALLAALTLGTQSARIVDHLDPNAERFDAPALTHPFGEVGDAALSPLARWDAVWYLAIADSGYEGAERDSPGPRAAFLPLYPLLVAALGGLAGGSPGALLLAAYAISLACFAGALHLLHRLAALEVGREAAGSAVLLLAVFPGALFFGAPYSESLFLLLSVGTVYAARIGRFGWASALAGCASATRSAGVLLLVPLAILYLYGPRADRSGSDRRRDGDGDGRLARLRAALRPRHSVRRDALWLGLAPLGLAGYATYLAVAHGDGLAFLDLQDSWYREFAGPLGGAVDGASAALDGLRQLASGSRETVFFEQSGGDPIEVAAENLTLSGFLAFALVACAGVLRRLPAAYGAYTATALALPLSFPVEPLPLMSLPRFLAVLFPIFIWLGLACRERRVVGEAATLSALLLCLFCVQFATWHWVA